jgi:hypothetical protein
MIGSNAQTQWVLSFRPRKNRPDMASNLRAWKQSRLPQPAPGFGKS